MNVTRFQCASADRLAPVLAADPAVPYRGHRGLIGNVRFDRWAVERGARLLCNASGAFEASSGAIAWKTLTWDSEFFGFPAARIEILAASGGYSEAREVASKLIESAVDDAAYSGVRHLVIRIDASSLAYSHALAENGFELIDGIQTFSLACGSPPGPPIPVESVRPATPLDAGAIAGIARSSFVFDRFHQDVSIGADAADRLHEAWARNSVAGEAADVVLLATSEDAIEAFVTVKIDLASVEALGVRFASIPLVATAPKAQGKGAARRATAAALAWCRAQSVDLIEVGTQISNIPAARLYQSAGFCTTAISLTYRKLL